MTKYSMYRYKVRGVTKNELTGNERVWTREVNAANANDAKWAAKSDWATKSCLRLYNVSATRIGIPGFNLSGWKEV